MGEVGRAVGKFPIFLNGMNQIGESVLSVQDRFANAVFNQPAFEGRQ
jgi:hypothetical protein